MCGCARECVSSGLIFSPETRQLKGTRPAKKLKRALLHRLQSVVSHGLPSVSYSVQKHKHLKSQINLYRILICFLPSDLYCLTVSLPIPPPPPPLTIRRDNSESSLSAFAFYKDNCKFYNYMSRNKSAD